MLIKSDEVSCHTFMYNYIKVKRDACPLPESAQSTLMALKCAVITTNMVESSCVTLREADSTMCLVLVWTKDKRHGPALSKDHCFDLVTFSLF